MKNKLRTLVVAGFLALSTSSASAATYLGGGFPISQVNSLYVYNSPSVGTAALTFTVDNAKSKLSSISSAKIEFYTTTAATYADVRVYAGSYPDSWYGLTDPYDAAGNPSPYDQWAYCKLFLNERTMNRDSFTGTNKTHNTLHEFGHVLSLAHQSSGSMMISGKQTIISPTSKDIANLQARY